MLFTHVEFHPRQPLSPQPVPQSRPLRHDKGSHVHQHDDAAAAAAAAFLA